MELLNAGAEKHTRVTSGRGHVKTPLLIVLHVQRNPIYIYFPYTWMSCLRRSNTHTVICDKHQVYTSLNEIQELNVKLLSDVK